MRARFLAWILGVVALLATPCWPRAALGAYPAPARVSVLTMGPGEHPFTRFGHNAILLEWDGGGPLPNLVFNFGTFAFDGMQGVKDFMGGRFRYWLSVTTLENTRRAYAAEHRSLTAQELELSAAERAALYRRLSDNAKPEHKYYDYDYYRDNCSTRVRDAIDQLLGGELKREVTGAGRLTFRQHTLRLVGDTPWLYFGLDAALGTPTDRPTTRWEELFLPQELHDALARAKRHVAGQSLPLVRHETQLLSAAPWPLPASPPERRGTFAAWGALLGSLLAALGFAASRSRAARAVFGSLTALFGTALGALGFALAAFWASKHWAAHDNPSLLACPPWALALAVLGGAFALSRGRSPTLLWVLGASLLASSLLTLLALAGLLGGDREALREGLLFTPVWAGWLAGAWLAQRHLPRGALKP
ncbi:MAG TPA: DUF4105 domain-containing protein [Polyangiaceae bacterium]|nr:DUF4105 domain-containing protein [Polyangiaceae bacterium]